MGYIYTLFVTGIDSAQESTVVSKGVTQLSRGMGKSSKEPKRTTASVKLCSKPVKSG